MTRYDLTISGSTDENDTATVDARLIIDDQADAYGMVIQSLVAAWNGLPLPPAIPFPAGVNIHTIRLEGEGFQYPIVDVALYQAGQFIAASRVEADQEAADETTPNPVELQRRYWSDFTVSHGFMSNDHIAGGNTYYHRATCPICGGEVVLTIVDEDRATVVHVDPDGHVDQVIARHVANRYYGMRSTGPSHEAEGRIRYELRLAIAGAHRANRPNYLAGFDFAAEPPEDLDAWIATMRRTGHDTAGQTYTKIGHYLVQTFREPASRLWRYDVKAPDQPADERVWVRSSGYDYPTDAEALSRGTAWAEANLKG